MKMTKDFQRSGINKGAIINVDNEGLQAYKRQRQLMKNLGSQEDRISKIESDIGEVKDLLKQMLEKGN
jgi:hypothetical protein